MALSLSVLLIGAIYSGLSLYFRYSETGQQDVERALLARSLLRKIEMDVRSVMYRPPATTTASSSTTSGSSTSGSGSTGSGTSSSGSGTSSSSGSSSSSSSSSSSTTTAPEDATTIPSTGLYGNATTLLMHVSKPGHEERALRLSLGGNVQFRTSDMATIAYFVTGTATGAFQQTTTGHGLARMEGDRLALANADAQSSTALMASCTQIVAPEVVAIHFLYFDGFRWRSDWDSSVMVGMPKAIDVKIQLSPIAGRAGTPDMYDLTIAIPLAKPVDTSLVTGTTQ